MTAVALRHPTPADHRRVEAVLDEWWGGRRTRHLLPRLWLEQFAGTSFLAEDEAGRLRGLAIACLGQDDPTIGVLYLIGTDPNARRGGIGRRLVTAVAAALAERGAREVSAVAWPGDRGAVDFLRAVGFRVDDGPGAQPLYGIPAFPDHDGDGQDRVVLRRSVGDAGTTAARSV